MQVRSTLSDPRDGRPRIGSGEAVHRFDLSPRRQGAVSDRLALGQDEVRYPIEEEFSSSLLSPRLGAAPQSPKQTVFHRLATPPRQRHSLGGPGSGEELPSSLRRGRRSLPGNKPATPSSEHTDPTAEGDSQSFPVEDEFAAWTAAQALQQMGSGRQEAETAWKMCLLREKLKCLQRSKEACLGTGRFTWAPALQEEGTDAQADSTTESTVAPVVDRDVWPSWQPQETSEVCEGAELAHVDAEAGAPPVASDLFFNFAEIEDAEEEQLSFLGSVFRAWAEHARPHQT